MKLVCALALFISLATSTFAADPVNAAAAPDPDAARARPKADTSATQSNSQPAGSTDPTNTPPKLKFSTAVERLPVVGEVARGIMVASTNQFSFVVPKGFRVRADEGTKKVVLVARENDVVISAQVHEYAGEFKPEALRDQAATKYANGKMVDQFPAGMQTHMGNAYSYQWRGPTGALVGSIAAFVPFGNGHLEFEVNGPGDKLDNSVYAFLNLLMSFRSAPVGSKLEVQAFLTEQ